MPFFKAVLATAALLAMGAAQAQPISGADIKSVYDGAPNTSFSVLASGALGLKTQNTFEGVGVQARTAGEIDIGESITLTFTAPTAIASFTLGLLFNGPEYNDVREVAQITINGTKIYTLTSDAADNTAEWITSGSSPVSVPYVFGAGTVGGLGGVVTVGNPFGSDLVSSMKFEALSGRCGTLGGSCTNQSDYNVVNVTAVPEPETYALMLAGLGAVAFMARRRRPTA